MADQVQHQMEQMIPELEDFQSRKLFNSEEIQQIVQKRRSFEYMMKRTPLQKTDCLRYLEYEINLNLLRMERKKAMNINRTGRSDSSCVQRIHFLFERTLKKFHGDVSLWMEYISFCKSVSSSKILSKVFAHSLQFHPRQEGLWIEAASWEFNENGSMDAARVLLQRALRINPECRRLWIEYFRLELLFIEKLIARREILGLRKEPTTSGDDSTIALSISEDADLITIDNQTKDVEKDKSRDLVIGGGIALIVYKNAISKFSDDVEFRMKFVEVLRSFPTCISDKPLEEVLQDIINSFPSSESAWITFAEETWRTEIRETGDILKALQSSNLVFQQAFEKINSIRMKEEYFSWLMKRLGDDNPSQLSKNHLSHIHQLIMTSVGQWMDAQVMSSDLYIHFIQYSLHISPRSTTLELLAKATEAFPECVDLILMQVEILFRCHEYSCKSSRAQLVDLLEKSMVKICSVERIRIYQKWIDIELSWNSSNPKLHKLFRKALNENMQYNVEAVDLLRQQYLNWVYLVEGIKSFKQISSSMFQSSVLSTDSSQKLAQFCINVIESWFVLCPQSYSNEIKDFLFSLYEKKIDLVGQNDYGIWKQYVQFLRDIGDHPKANLIHWRATQTLGQESLSKYEEILVA